MDAGCENRAEHPTRFWAHRHHEEGEFKGTAIVIAEAATKRLDGDPLDFAPKTSLDGVVGVGLTRTGDPSGLGTGVVGLGGGLAGTGVVGRGAGGSSEGLGGIGVHGIGGSRRRDSATIPPGPGVVGQGGAQPEKTADGVAHGAGVIALGANQPIPPITETRSAGLYAAGADANPVQSPEGPAAGFVGVKEAGPGVIGIGGKSLPRFGNAAGVIGLASGMSVPAGNPDEPNDTGVYGRAERLGVAGYGKTGVYAEGGVTGVRAIGTRDGIWASAEKEGRGGVFSAGRQAQISLVPHFQGGNPAEQNFTARAIPAARFEEGGMDLPVEGERGDLLAITHHSDNLGAVTTLWFCVASKGDPAGQGKPAYTTAKWRQVLLGPDIGGA